MVCFFGFTLEWSGTNQAGLVAQAEMVQTVHLEKHQPFVVWFMEY